MVIDLKIEDFKPEFAGKMNFYLSAVDDCLRHPEDCTSIGIILCRGRNELIVEYALRDTSKPMGVAQYRLTKALPRQLQAALPTSDEIAREFPLLSLVHLRIEIEQRLLALLRAKSPDQEKERATRPNASHLAFVLHRHRQISNQLLHAIQDVTDRLSRAVHGEEITTHAAMEALTLGQKILTELEELRNG